MINISKETINKRFQYQNLEILDKYINNKKTIILCLGHYCNWEWGLLSISNKLKCNILGVYKKLKNKTVNQKNT